MANLKNIKICTQNVNSLCSGGNNARRRNEKILAIKNLKADIIILTDTRLNTNKSMKGLENIKNILDEPFMEQYKIIDNSRLSNRGVCFVYKKNLKLEILEEIKDENCNSLALKLNLNNLPLLIWGIYGPNNIDIDFYNNIKFKLIAMRKEGWDNIILIGDFNTVMDERSPHPNKDLIATDNFPLKRNSEILNQICRELGLIDIFRLKNGKDKLFTYKHLSSGREARSRIDFALISDSLNTKNLSASVGSKIFTKADHKPVLLEWGQKIKPPKKLIYPIFESTTDHWLAEYICFFEFLDTFIFHAKIPNFCKETFMANAGKINRCIQTLKKKKILLKKSGEILEENYEDINELRKLYDEAPPLEFFYIIELTTSKQIFHELVMGKITHSLGALQKTILFLRREREENLKKKFFLLDHIKDRDKIEEYELELEEILQTRLLGQIRERECYKFFEEERITPSFLKIMQSCKETSSLKEIKNDKNEPLGENYLKFIETNFEKKFSAITVSEEKLTDIYRNTEQYRLLREVKKSEYKDLEKDVTMSEVEKAVKKLNKKAAPGPDGIKANVVLLAFKHLKYILLA